MLLGFFFFYELAEPCAVPQLWQRKAAAPRTASAGAPGGLAGHERELRGQAGVDVLDAASGGVWEHVPGLFPFFPPVCLCWMCQQTVPSADGL